ncbi:MAG: hypothetical protein ACI4MQ_06715 [Candidatus Coproplasma sp.]
MKRKRKETKLYISTEDIGNLHERYAPIFKQLFIDQDCGEFYINAMVETTMTTLTREIEELSEKNRLDIETKNARTNAANEEQIPRFFRPLRRFFRRTPNRAMAAILDEAAIAAEDSLSKLEHQNDIDNVAVGINLASLKTSEELPKDEKGKHLSRRRLKKLLKDPKSFLALFAVEEPEEEQSDVEVNELGEESEQQNVANVQSEEPELQNVANVQDEEVVEQVTDEPVATLPKRKRRRRKPEADEQEQTQSPNEEQPDQLPGQLEIEEINAEDGGQAND